MLGVAPTPTLGRAMSRSRLVATLRRGGRKRRVEERASEVQAALRSEQLAAPPLVEAAMGASVRSLVAVLSTMRAEISRLEQELASGFNAHPDAKVVRTLPGLGTVLGARVLGEFGDDPNRYATPKSRKNYAGTSPITRASGTKTAVLARRARNRRLAVPSTCGPFPPSTPLLVLAPTTTPTGPKATRITRRYEPLATAWWVSCTAAWPTRRFMTNTRPGLIGNDFWTWLDKLGPWDVYVEGVSTRRVDDIVKAMGIEGISKSQVSAMAKELDGLVEAFRSRPLDAGPYTYIWLDALTQKVREGGRVVNVAVVIATGVNNEGRRESLGFDVITTEDGAGWTAFLRSLVARGLQGVALVTSDDHKGLMGIDHLASWVGEAGLAEPPAGEHY